MVNPTFQCSPSPHPKFGKLRPLPGQLSPSRTHRGRSRVRLGPWPRPGRQKDGLERLGWLVSCLECIRSSPFSNRLSQLVKTLERALGLVPTSHGFQGESTRVNSARGREEGGCVCVHENKEEHCSEMPQIKPPPSFGFWSSQAQRRGHW